MLDTSAGGDRRSRASFLDDLRHVAARAVPLDEDGAFPSDDLAGLAAIGALVAPFGAPGRPGLAVGAPEELAEALRIIGHASLPLGRLYEGHVNAAALIARHGTRQQQARARSHAEGGALFGVWNTEGEDGVRLVRQGRRLSLTGAKIFASGAGHIACPLITARNEQDELLMVLPKPDGTARADLSAWQAHGMRASASGSFRFDGLVVQPEDILGGPGDYHRQPFFSAGAWRFCAVQLGGIERLVDEARGVLRARGRDGDPHQLARMGEAAIAAETARLWVEHAAALAEADDAGTPGAGERAVAYVDLARCAVERAGLEVMQLVQRSIGLSAFLRTSPVERLCRDLSTYLRQPAPDRALCGGAAYVLGRRQGVGGLWQ